MFLLTHGKCETGVLLFCWSLHGQVKHLHASYMIDISINIRNFWNRIMMFLFLSFMCMTGK